MKNLLVLLAIVMMAVPAMAVQVMTAADGTDVTISYALDQDEVGLRGVALTVTLVGGTLQSVDDIVALNSEFNAYIDYYVANDVPAELPGDGHPLCNPDAAGVAVLPNAVFGICMGYLDENTEDGLGDPAPGADTDLITFTVTCDEGAEMVEVTVALDELRGGIVGDALVGATMPAMLEVACVTDCWGNPCQAKGDANEDGFIDGVDVNALIQAFGTAAGGAGYDKCADFNHDGFVDGVDVNVLVMNFGQQCP